MEDEKALRAARFTEGAATNESDVSTDKSALDSKLEGSLDDIVKAQRQSRKEEMAKKKKETQNKQKQQKQQQQQQQTKNQQNKQGKNSPAKFKQAAPVRGAAKPVSRQAVQQKSQNNKPRQQQGRISQDESFARMNSSFNRQQQPKKSNDAKQAKRQEASLALIDPQEAAIRQQRADRFKQ
jgi:hypothetical protein